MNSMKYFNWNFFKQNAKKSTGVLIVIFLTLPLVTFFQLLSYIKSDTFIVPLPKLSIFTYLGGIIIPFILAYILFGFLFKQKSVDFYLSKPISRKTMYISNAIGGLFLILLLIGINTCIISIFGFISNIALPFGLILDYFLYALSLYVFLFAVFSLAMAFSGNLMTTFVIALLLFFLFPFAKVTSNLMAAGYGDSYYYCDSEECRPNNFQCLSDECKEHQNDNTYYLSVNKIADINLTTLFSMSAYGGYRVQDVVKTFILAIIYLGIGYVLFIKRKMENIGGFTNPYVHFGIKTLTLLPFAFISYAALVDVNGFWLMIAVVVSLAYYFIYDLITRKSIYKWPITVFVFVGTFLTIFVSYYVLGEFYKKDRVFNSVDKIVVDQYELLNKNYKNIEITDKSLINTLVKELISTRNYTGQYIVTTLTLTMNNQKYTTNLIVDEKIEKLINDYIGENKVKSTVEDFDFDRIDYISLDDNPIKMTKELKKMLKNVNSENINKYDHQLYYELYKYENHEYKSIVVNINSSEDLAKYATNNINSLFLKNLNNANYYYLYLIGADDYDYGFNYVFSKYKTEFLKYFEEHKNDTLTDNYYLIHFSLDNKTYSYIINDIDAFNSFYQEYKDLCKNDLEYPDTGDSNEYQY